MRRVSPLLFQRHSSERHTRASAGLLICPSLTCTYEVSPFHPRHARSHRQKSQKRFSPPRFFAQNLGSESSHWCSVVSFLCQSQDSRLVRLHALVCPDGGGTFLNNPFRFLARGRKGCRQPPFLSQSYIHAKSIYLLLPNNKMC